MIGTLLGLLLVSAIDEPRQLVRSAAEPTDLAAGNPHFVIVHAEVLGVSARMTSHDDPARARIRVHDVLRGRQQETPHEMDAILTPPVTAAMMIDPQAGNYSLTAREARRQYIMPAPGDHVMLAYCCLGRASALKGNAVRTQAAIVRWTPANEAIIRGAMAKPEASERRQVVLFSAIAVATVAAFGLLRRRQARAAAVALFVVALIAYGLYESGISSHTNIRVDLFLLGPLVVADILGIVLVAKSFVRTF